MLYLAIGTTEEYFFFKSGCIVAKSKKVLIVVFLPIIALVSLVTLVLLESKKLLIRNFHRFILDYFHLLGYKLQTYK